jgi:hypothetical protein
MTLFEVTKGTGNKRFGMYVGEPNNPDCKRNTNICITSAKTNNFRDTILINTQEQYKRNVIKNGEIIHRVGDFKYKNILAIRPLTDIKSAWKHCNEYPTVSYGLNCFRREVLIIDSDYAYASLNQLKSYVSLFCKEAQLPEPSYVIRNPKSGHGQIGWFMSVPFESMNKTYSFNDFNASIKALAYCWNMITKLDGDYCFNGPACKNPYYKGFESSISDSVIDTYYFIDLLNKARNNTLLSYNNTSSYSSFSDNTLETPKKLTKQATRKAIDKRLCESDKGRNCYLMNHLRTRIFQFMNKNQGVAPTLQETIDIAMEINGKFDSKLDNNEVLGIVKSVRPWCINNYSSEYINHTDTTNARKISIIVKKCNKLVLMSEALAGKVSVSKGQMSKYKHMTEEEIKDLYSYKNQFIDYISSIRNNCSVLNESFEGYIVLENKLNNISLESLLPYKYTSSYSSFSDNTLETLENKPKRTIIKVQEEIKEVSDEELVSILDRMNNPDWYNEDGTKKNRLIIKTA